MTDAARSVWQGPRLRLRAFEATDWPSYAAWDREDDDQARNLSEISLPRSETAVRRWADEEASRMREADNARFVIVEEGGEVVGDLTIHSCSPRVGTFSYGISISRDRRRRGYATEAIGIVLRHYFGERRYQKVTVGIASFNEASIRLHERLGFQLEGRLRRMWFTGGNFFDELVVGLTVEEFAERGR